VGTHEEDILAALKVELDSGYLTEVGPAEEIFGLLMKAYPPQWFKDRLEACAGCN